jgi:uncharacterized membrane protein YfcA
MEILLLVLIGLASGLVKGTSGFGSSLVAIPLLFLVGYTQGEIVTMMITCNIALNILLVYENKSYFHFETVKRIYPIILGGVIFTGVGLLFRDSINQYVIELIAAGLILVAIINKITKLDLKIKENFISLFTVGICSGIGNGLASIDGPPVVFFLTSINAPKKRFKSTLATHFLVMGVVGVIMLAFTDSYNVSIITNTLYLFLSLVVGLLLGMFIGRKLNEEMFQKVVLVILIGLMISLVLP